MKKTMKQKPKSDDTRRVHGTSPTFYQLLLITFMELCMKDA